MYLVFFEYGIDFKSEVILSKFCRIQIDQISLKTLTSFLAKLMFAYWMIHSQLWMPMLESICLIMSLAIMDYSKIKQDFL